MTVAEQWGSWRERRALLSFCRPLPHRVCSGPETHGVQRRPGAGLWRQRKVVHFAEQEQVGEVGEERVQTGALASLLARAR